MALKIRLARGGAKKRPHYRIVIADSRAPRDGRFIEIVGTHNPLLPKDHADRVTLKEERIRHWLSVGARPTDRVHRFLDAAGILERAPRNNPQKAEWGTKRKEREEAKKQAEEDAKAAAETAEAEAAEAPEEASEDGPEEAAEAPAEAAEESAEDSADNKGEAPAEEEAPAEPEAAAEPEAEAADEGGEKKEEAAE